MRHGCTWIKALWRKDGIGVRIDALSDAHCNSIDSRPKKLVHELSGTELIIHAGGFTGKRLIDDSEVRGEIVEL